MSFLVISRIQNQIVNEKVPNGRKLDSEISTFVGYIIKIQLIQKISAKWRFKMSIIVAIILIGIIDEFKFLIQQSYNGTHLFGKYLIKIVYLSYCRFVHYERVFYGFIWGINHGFQYVGLWVTEVNV